MYGINLVQTKMDTAVRRGAIVKAMAIFSRYHYTDIFKEILSIALEAYFEEKNVSVRRLGSQNTTVVKLDQLINDLKKESLSPLN